MNIDLDVFITPESCLLFINKVVIFDGLLDFDLDLDLLLLRDWDLLFSALAVVPRRKVFLGSIYRFCHWSLINLLSAWYRLM